jgi:hypothetical protein
MGISPSYSCYSARRNCFAKRFFKGAFDTTVAETTLAATVLVKHIL